jgi:hypothetical protein
MDCGGMGSVSGVSGAMIVLARKCKVVAIRDHTYSWDGIIRNSRSSDSSIMELIQHVEDSL